MKTFLNMIGVYFKSYKALWIGQGLSLLVFAVVVTLYDIPADAWQYAGLLMIVILTGVTAIDFYRVYRKHLKLRANILDPSSHMIDGAYLTIIQKQADEIKRIVTEADLTRTDLLDYYSLWVHQVKTPISAIHLMLQTSRTHETTALKLELFKIEQYVDMALNYLRLDADSSDFVIKPYDLAEIVKMAIKKYRGIFIEKNLSVNFEMGSFMTITDEKWMAFAIEQVLSNALKYTQTGSITFKMEGNDLVVQDTGCGIRPEDLPRVFEKGYTGYNGRMDRKSTGIGLYLVKRTLTKLGHGLVITSDLGKGTEVRLQFEPYKDVRLNREM
jgi:signal transduction histidine kinase